MTDSLYVVRGWRKLLLGTQPATNEDLVPESIRQIMNERTDWDGMLEEPVPLPIQQR